eukprot:scaffold2421_cov145-Skeletonema_marinoi.AAC.5
MCMSRGFHFQDPMFAKQCIVRAHHSQSHSAAASYSYQDQELQLPAMAMLTSMAMEGCFPLHRLCFRPAKDLQIQDQEVAGIYGHAASDRGRNNAGCGTEDGRFQFLGHFTCVRQRPNAQSRVGFGHQPDICVYMD